MLFKPNDVLIIKIYGNNFNIIPIIDRSIRNYWIS